VLANLSSLFSWYAVLDERFTPPIVRGMRRDKRQPSERARSRILSDPEIAALWQATETPSPFSGLCRLLLLTASRLAKVVDMKHGDIDGDGVWTIRTEAREKSNAGSLKLPAIALDIIAAQPRFEGVEHVIVNAGGSGPLPHFQGSKRSLDKAMKVVLGYEPERWTLHDLRRTARSLMARAGVADRVAEMVLGHTIKGVERTYLRYRYDPEKAQALEALSLLIDRIVNPADNVMSLTARR
jgi:integrase